MKADLRLPIIQMDAHAIAQLPEVARESRERSDIFIVDPVTHIIPYKESSGKANYQKLPYANVDIDRILSDPTYRLESLVKPVVAYQIENGADIVIAPYLYSEDQNSSQFNISLTMLSETVINARTTGKPVYATICIGSSALLDPTVIHYIVGRYRDDYQDTVSGYIVVVNDLDDRDAEVPVLRGLAYLAHLLSKDKKVYVRHIGGFGEVLCALGADGFISALAEGESFAVSNLRSAAGRGRNHNEWTYVPELFDYVNDVELAPNRINYQCDCPACAGDIVDVSPTCLKKLHFLFRRNESVSRIAEANHDERARLVDSRLNEAHRLASEYIARFGATLRTHHIVKWATVLREAGSWPQEQDDAGIEALLADLESKVV